MTTFDLDAALGLLMPESAPELLKRFAQLWLAKRASNAMPRFRDMDPVEMPWALNTIFVLRRREDGVFAYQLAGEGMESRMGGRLKGKTAFDVFEQGYAEFTEARWQKAATKQSACFVQTQHLSAAGIPLNSTRLLFPLKGDSDRVDVLIGVAEFQGTETKLLIESERHKYTNIIWTPVDSLSAPREQGDITNTAHSEYRTGALNTRPDINDQPSARASSEPW